MAATVWKYYGVGKFLTRDIAVIASTQELLIRWSDRVKKEGPEGILLRDCRPDIGAFVRVARYPEGDEPKGRGT